MTTPDPHHLFMGLALDQARQALAEGNRAVGSVIVKDGRVVGRGRNLALSRHDPTAHAEVTAIRDACGNLGTTDLSGATCYTTVEPCPMCCWAIVSAGIQRLVLGARFAGLENTNVGGYAVEKLLALTGRDLEIVTGLRVAECTSVRNSWPGWKPASA